MGKRKHFPIITRLGGYDYVYRALQASGHGLRNPRYMYRWAWRDSLPGPVILALMEMADKARIDYRAEDFRLTLKV